MHRYQMCLTSGIASSALFESTITKHTDHTLLILYKNIPIIQIIQLLHIICVMWCEDVNRKRAKGVKIWQFYGRCQILQTLEFDFLWSVLRADRTMTVALTEVNNRKTFSKTKSPNRSRVICLVEKACRDVIWQMGQMELRNPILSIAHSCPARTYYKHTFKQ